MFKIITLPPIAVPSTVTSYYINYTPSKEEFSALGDGVIINSLESVLEDNAELSDLFDMIKMDNEVDYDEDDSHEVDYDDDDIDMFIEPYLNLPGFEEPTTHYSNSLVYIETPPKYLLIYAPAGQDKYMILCMSDTKNHLLKVKSLYESTPVKEFRFKLLYDGLKANKPESLYSEEAINNLIIDIQSNYRPDN